VCGRQFHSAKYTSRYCSENCYVKAKNWAKETRYNLELQGNKKTLNELLYNKVCPQCGLHFTSKKTNAIYCSQSCGKKYRAALRSENERQNGRQNSFDKSVDFLAVSRRIKVAKICPCCGREFAAEKSTTMFCSGNCARKYRRRQEAAERREKVTAEQIKHNIDVKESFTPDSQFLRASDAAKYLGVSTRTVLRYIDQGIIKAKRLPRVTLIERTVLREVLESDVSLHVKTKAKIEVPPKDESNPIFNGEHITIPEASKLYDVPLNVMQNYLRRSDLKFTMYRNTRFYDKKEVDRYVKKRLRDRRPDIKEWYSVNDILTKFNITSITLNNQLYKASVPKRKDGGYTYYSKSHIDEMFGYLLESDKYYTTEQLSEMYQLDKRRISKIVQRYSLPKITRSGRILIEKVPFDEFMRLNKMR
jgi:excisionase family DNA binding protein